MAKYHFTLPLLTIVLTAATPGFEDTSLLDRQVAGHLGAAIGDVGGALAPIDPKLKLKRCAEALDISETHRNAVLISCPQIGWRIFVPVRLGGKGGNAHNSGGGMAQEPLVQRNQPVTMVIRRANFSVSYSVIAQESGALGDYIPVRTDRKSKELIARVSGADEVELSH
ncbi:flagella basal body P-ring formation protein FlgA [Parasphingorhabdus sp.]|uniref:flagella basal body P-ring formation protein FlgA n=1 Tax=Parasphingorhabdus sp. TaxID=2709688 RepID=UPI0030017ED4